METVKKVSALQHATHTVFNQPPSLVDYNVFVQDAALVESVQREGAGWAQEHLNEIGVWTGRSDVIQWGFDANTVEPILHTSEISKINRGCFSGGKDEPWCQDAVYLD